MGDNSPNLVSLAFSKRVKKTFFSKVTVPVALLWSDNDWLADPTDVAFLEPILRISVSAENYSS
jgi:hypothetical protein